MQFCTSYADRCGGVGDSDATRSPTRHDVVLMAWLGLLTLILNNVRDPRRMKQIDQLLSYGFVSARSILV
jgi:hypothetical protein